MTTVTNSSPSLKPKIVVPSTDTKSASGSPKKDTSSKTKPEFIVRTNYPESNAPLGVSVSKFNRNHILVRNQINHRIEILFYITIISLNVVFLSLHNTVY